jgi:hypothetical protein
MSKKRKVTFLCLILPVAALLISGCAGRLSPSARTDIGSCILDVAPSSSDEQAIRAVLAAEGELVVKQDIAPLMQLWAEEGYVADAKNTPQTSDDDQFWLNKDAIRHRYVRTVFPGAPQQATPSDLVISIEDDHAVVTATTRIGSEISPAGDRWTLAQVDGCWLLESLTYNLESNR